MTDLTIFSAPKPFSHPHIATIQRNAIQSWKALGSQVEVILVGEEEGLAETAAEFGIPCLPKVKRNKQGTPLVSSIFSMASKAAHSPLMAYVNGDILLLGDFLLTASQVSQQLIEFLVIGQRWDLAIREALVFKNGWDREITQRLNAHGRLHPPAGSDYFIFPRSIFTKIPDFAIGRAGWDNWMIYHAHQQGWPVVDATPSLKIIHQEHDYSHLPGGKPHYDLEESSLNMSIAGGLSSMYYVLDCDRQLVGGKLAPPRLTYLRFLRKMEMWLMPKGEEHRGWRWAIARKFRRARRFRMQG